MSTLEQQAKAPADLRNVAQFLRGSNSGMKIRVGALNGKRIDYFKGALLNQMYTKFEADV
jgi:translocation protein SEC62